MTDPPQIPAPGPASPCIRICRIGHHGHCVGCGRDLDEITAWGCAAPAQRQDICERAAARLQEFKDGEIADE